MAKKEKPFVLIWDGKTLRVNGKLKDIGSGLRLAALSGANVVWQIKGRKTLKVGTVPNEWKIKG